MLTHPRLAHAIMALRPGTKPQVDFVCVDNGNGPTLVDGSMVNPPTQAEVDALTTAQLDAAQAEKSFSVEKLELRIAFNHENRIRALEGKAAITQAQFITALKALLAQ